MPAQKNPGSYKDPHGYVFHYDGAVLRTILPPAKANYEFIRDKGTITESIKEGFLVDVEELDKCNVPDTLADAAYVVRHFKIPLISYPYEWSFSQLKEAALHHLRFQIFLLERDATLRDASAYNIQFIGSRPIFIDLLSIGPYKEGDYWLAHSQFCEQFLNPLLLRALKGITHNGWFRGNLDGIYTRDLAKLLSLKDKVSWNVFSQIIVQAHFEATALKNPTTATFKAQSRKPLPRKSYNGFLVQLFNWINKLEPKDTGKTVWGEYATNNTYLDEEADKKRLIVQRFAEEYKFDKLIDLGCNTGDYSIEALNSGVKFVVGYDFDTKAVDQAFLRAQKQGLNFLPLYLDAANPSPNQGWRQAERLGFQERNMADGIIALAFIHHLAIAKNIPLDQIVTWITGIAPRGLIEFVPKSDITVGKMLALREDIFSDYSEENFIKILSSQVNILSSQTVSSSGRTIFEYSSI
jgi:ribosomal protein L11 methylase PrmA